MAHQRDYVDIVTGDEFYQDHPGGPLVLVRTGDGTAPTGQRPRTWEYLTASGRDLQPA